MVDDNDKGVQSQIYQGFVTSGAAWKPHPTAYVSLHCRVGLPCPTAHVNQSTGNRSYKSNLFRVKGVKPSVDDLVKGVWS